MNDNFRSIPNYAGYRVSRLGDVQSCWARHGRFCLPTETWLPLKPIVRDGYCTVNLPRAGTKDNRRIHRLVLEAFVGPCPPGSVACHWDGVRTNNRLENLRWGTHQANSDDAIRHGTKARGEALKPKLSEAQVFEIRRLRVDGLTIKALADRFLVSESNVRSVVRGRTWRHLLPPADSKSLDPNSTRSRGISA
jgi:hypothetical protein